MKALLLSLVTLASIATTAHAAELPMMESYLTGISPTLGLIEIEQARNGDWVVKTKTECKALPCSVNEWTTQSSFTPNAVVSQTGLNIQIGPQMTVAVARNKNPDGYPGDLAWNVFVSRAGQPSESVSLRAETRIALKPIISK